MSTFVAERIGQVRAVAAVPSVAVPSWMLRLIGVARSAGSMLALQTIASDVCDARRDDAVFTFTALAAEDRGERWAIGARAMLFEVLSLGSL